MKNDIKTARSILITELIIIPITFVLYQKYEDMAYIFVGEIFVALLINLIFIFRLSAKKPKGYLLWNVLLLIPLILIIGAVFLFVYFLSKMGC